LLLLLFWLFKTWEVIKNFWLVFPVCGQKWHEKFDKYCTESVDHVRYYGHFKILIFPIHKYRISFHLALSVTNMV
jgi:hypothetical protein